MTKEDNDRRLGKKNDGCYLTGSNVKIFLESRRPQTESGTIWNMVTMNTQTVEFHDGLFTVK